VKLVVTAVGALVAIALLPSGAVSQEPPSTATTEVEVPTQDIVPAPNSGEAPHEAGDRGGALQLALLGLLVVGVGAGVLLVVRQSRRSRDAARS
jgi:hypothetical protein